MSDRVEGLGRRFARFANDAVVARPGLWRLFRLPLRRYFDRLAPGWEGRRADDRLLPLGMALDRLDAAPASILDLGTGTGIAARVLAKRFPVARVIGADVSAKMVREAERLRPPELRDRLEFVVADAASLSFGDDEFDLVVLVNMIPFFDELARITAPAGAVILAFSSGPSTPIYVPTETLRERLEPYDFVLEELEAGGGTAVLARRTSTARGVGDGEGRDRTGDTTVFSRVLYQLSYLAARVAV